MPNNELNSKEIKEARFKDMKKSYMEHLMKKATDPTYGEKSEEIKKILEKLPLFGKDKEG